MPSQKNLELLKKTRDVLKDGKAFYFTEFTGITVAKLETLRRELKKNQGTYLVVKNTLGLIAMKEMGFDDNMIGKIFTSATGIAIAYDDPIVLAKVLRDAENIKIKGGIIEGEFYDTSSVLRFSEIPSKFVLYGQLAGSLNLLGNLAGILEEIMRKFVHALEAVKNQKGDAK
jgi:large subunit ribosomal protein L10